MVSAGRIPRALALVTALAAGTLAWGQSGGLRVRVVDMNGEGLPGATVTLSNSQQLVAKTSLATDGEGWADFPVLRPGAGYALEVWFPGYARQKVAGLKVRIGDSAEIAVSLTPEIRETVEVTARREVVDLEKTASTTKFTDEFIADLPVQGRFYQNVLTLAPGVLDPDEDGNPNVHGGRSRDFKALVSGVSNVDPLTGEWLSHVNPDSIEEMEVITTGAGVEFGRAQGGFAQIVQKQGSNDFEGVVTFLFSSSKLDGDGATDVADEAVPDFEWLQPSVQLTGPIVRDRLWFRLSHEYIDRDEPVNVGAEIQVTGRTQSIHSDQLTWQATPRNKLILQYDYDPKTLTNVGLTSRVGPESAQRHEFGGPTWGLTWTSAYSPRLLFDSGIAYQDHEVNVLPMTTGIGNECLLNVVYPVLNQAQCFWTNANQLTGSYYLSSRDRRQRLTARTQVEWFGGRFWGMTHRIKLGFIAENERYFRTLEQRPDVTWTTTIPLGPPRGDASYRVPVPGTSTARVTGANWGLYFEDQVRPAAGLTVTLGARLDQEGLDSIGWSPFDPQAEQAEFARRVGAGELPVLVTQQVFTAYQNIQAFKVYLADLLGTTASTTILSPTTEQSTHWLQRRVPEDLTIRNTNVSPRFAVAWDPFRDGKTKLSVSAGRYYDKIFLAVPLIELEPATTFLSFNAVRQGRIFIANSAGNVDAAISSRIVDRNLRTPYQDEIAIAFEREVAAETSVRVTWLDRRFEDQLQDIDINHAPADLGRCVFRSFRWVLVTTDGPDDELDDCFGGPDGITDLYVLNPGWAEVLLVGNFNTTRYKAGIVELTRRLYRSWQMEASYTWSEAIGDAEDFDQVLGNDRTTAEDEHGHLDYDQRHVFKLSATSVTPWGFRLGGTVQYESGLPYSILLSQETPDASPPLYIDASEERLRLTYPTGQRNDQRNPAFWTFNLRAAKEWSVGKGGVFGVSAEVFNLLNDDRIRIFDQTDGTLDSVRRFGRRWQLGMRATF